MTDETTDAVQFESADLDVTEDIRVLADGGEVDLSDVPPEQRDAEEAALNALLGVTDDDEPGAAPAPSEQVPTEDDEQPFQLEETPEEIARAKQRARQAKYEAKKAKEREQEADGRVFVKRRATRSDKPGPLSGEKKYAGTTEAQWLDAPYEDAVGFATVYTKMGQFGFEVGPGTPGETQRAIAVVATEYTRDELPKSVIISNIESARAGDEVYFDGGQEYKAEQDAKVAAGLAAIEARDEARRLAAESDVDRTARENEQARQAKLDVLHATPKPSNGFVWDEEKQMLVQDI
jgi:hypothetical protein